MDTPIESSLMPKLTLSEMPLLSMMPGPIAPPSLSQKMTADLLWRHLKPEWPNQYLRYFAKRSDPSGKKLTTGGVIEGAEHLSLLMARLSHHQWDAYIQLNPSSDYLKKRASAKDVAAYRWFSMDIDPLEGALLEPFQINVPAPLIGLQEHAFYIHTGRGIQIWWRATPIVIDDEAVRRRLHWLNTNLLKETILSTAEWKVDFLPDLPRLVRMPETINSKNGRTAIVSQWPREGFLYMDTLKALEWAGNPPPPPEPPKLSKFKWQHALPHLSLMAKTFIMEGVDSKDADSPGRHHAAVAAARSLRDAQIPYEGALVAVLRGAQRCRPAVDYDLSFTTTEVMRIVAGAYDIA